VPPGKLLGSTSITQWLLPSQSPPIHHAPYHSCYRPSFDSIICLIYNITLGVMEWLPDWFSKPHPDCHDLIDLGLWVTSELIFHGLYGYYVATIMTELSFWVMLQPTFKWGFGYHGYWSCFHEWVTESQPGSNCYITSMLSMLSMVMRFPWVPGCNGYNTHGFASGITPWASVAIIMPDKRWYILANESSYDRIMACITFIPSCNGLMSNVMFTPAHQAKTCKMNNNFPLILMFVWNQYFCMDAKHVLSQVKFDIRYKSLLTDA